MINRTLFGALASAVMGVCAFGQPGLLGSAATYSKDGWKFSVSYVIKPPLAPGQHSSIQGQTDVMHTEADPKAGTPVIFHRFLTDPVSKSYWGYDVVVEPSGQGDSATLRFRPFSLHADQLDPRYHAADFRALPLPQFPAETFASGQTIALDVLANPATGQKVIDYVQVSYEPWGHVPVKSAPRDFQVSDVVLHLVVPSLRVNDAAVPPAIVADRMLSRRLVWLSVPGRGRFLLSLVPYPGYGFQKAGTVSAFTLAFSWNGDRYECRTKQAITESSGAWNLYVLAAPAGQGSATEFSYGGVDSVEEFLGKAK